MASLPKFSVIHLMGPNDRSEIDIIEAITSFL